MVCSFSKTLGEKPMVKKNSNSNSFDNKENGKLSTPRISGTGISISKSEKFTTLSPDNNYFCP